MTHFDVDSMGAWTVSFDGLKQPAVRFNLHFKHKKHAPGGFYTAVLQKATGSQCGFGKAKSGSFSWIELSVKIWITNALVAISAEILRRVLNALNALYRQFVQFHSSCECLYINFPHHNLHVHIGRHSQITSALKVG